MATKRTVQPRKTGRKAPPPGETRRDKFVRLCESRMKKAIKAIELLGNLAAPHYHSDPKSLDAMHSALMDAIERAFTRFEARERQEGPPFTLPR